MTDYFNDPSVVASAAPATWGGAANHDSTVTSAATPTAWGDLTFSEPSVCAVEKEFSGAGYFSGTTTVNGVAVGNLTVNLHERLTGALVATTKSANDGSYSFVGVSLNWEYYAIALDDATGVQYNLVGADKIVPLRF